MFTRHSVVFRGCKSRIYRSVFQYSSSKIEKDSKNPRDVVESECDSGDYLGVTASGHLEETTEEIQNVLSKEELSQMYGIGIYKKPHAYDGKVEEAYFGSIKIDGVRKGYIPVKEDFSTLQPKLGSIANTLTRYRKNVDWKTSPQPISHLLMKQSKVYDSEKDDVLKERVSMNQHNSTETCKHQIDIEDSTYSKPDRETIDDSIKTNKSQVLSHQEQNNFAHNACRESLTQPEEAAEKISNETYSRSINRMTNATHQRTVSNKIGQIDEPKIMQMDETNTAEKREIMSERGVEKNRKSMEAGDLFTDNTDKEKSYTYKDMQNVSKEETSFNDAKLQQKALKTEKRPMKCTLEHEMDKHSWEDPLDSLLNSYEERQIDNVMPVRYETDNLQVAGEVASRRESSMPVLEVPSNAPMVENAAYRFFQDLQRDEQVSRIDKESTVDLSKYLHKRVDKLTEDEVLDELVESIIYNRDDILAINKIYGIPSQGGEGVRLNIADLLPKLAARIRCENLHLVHRLDKETTGIMLFGKTEEMANRLRKAFKNRDVKKTYLVITKGIPSIKEGIIDVPISEGEVGKDKKKRMTCIPVYDTETKHVMHKSKKKMMPAITHYRVVANSNSCALLEVRPETGVKHQIRTHLLHVLKTPVLGDHKYSYLSEIKPQILPSDIVRRLGIRQSKTRNLPMYIHAKFIMIPDFLDGRSFSVHCSVPRAFRSLLKRAKISHKNVDAL